MGSCVFKERKIVVLRRKKSGLENLVLISQLGINVMTSVFLCLMAGYWLDRQFGTSLILPFLIIGILAGGMSAYKMAKHTIDKEKAEIEREREKQVQEWERQFGTGDGAGRNKRKGW